MSGNISSVWVGGDNVLRVVDAKSVIFLGHQIFKIPGCFVPCKLAGGTYANSNVLADCTVSGFVRKPNTKSDLSSVTFSYKGLSVDNLSVVTTLFKCSSLTLTNTANNWSSVKLRTIYA